MKKKTKALTLVLSISMIVSVTGCSSKTEESVSENSNVEITQEAPEPTEEKVTEETSESVYSADVITGATLSSNGVIEAVNNALGLKRE